MSSDRDQAILESGINIGDTVITSPIRGVADGMRVAVVSSGTLSSEPVTAAGDK